MKPSRELMDVVESFKSQVEKIRMSNPNTPKTGPATYLIRSDAWAVRVVKLSPSKKTAYVERRIGRKGSKRARVEKMIFTRRQTDAFLLKGQKFGRLLFGVADQQLDPNF